MKHSLDTLRQIRDLKWYLQSPEEFRNQLWKRWLTIPGTLRNSILILLIVTVLLGGVSKLSGFYDRGNKTALIDGILTEAHGMWFDILILSVFATVLNLANDKRQNTQRYNEEIDDFLGWEELEATYRIVGNIRRINKLGSAPKTLQKAYLLKASLSSSNLSKSNLWEANLTKATLSYADLSHAFLVKADLSEAFLLHANLEGAYLYETKLIGANLTNTDLRHANLVGADLSGADLTGAKLDDAKLSNPKIGKPDPVSRIIAIGPAKVKWNENTTWPSPDEVAKAKNIPEKLKQQLRIE